MKQYQKYILIIVFAILFSFVIQDGIRLVIQKFLEIPDDSMGLVQWGDTFFLRIFASLIGTTAGAFVIGTFLKNKVKLFAIITTVPIILFWIIVFTSNITNTLEQAYSFEVIKTMLLLPGILIILSPVVAYLGAGWGQEYFETFQHSNSILNIKWYHWLWILPFYLNKVIAIPLFTLILLWKIDLLYGNSGLVHPGIFDLIFNWGYYLVRIIIFIIFAGLISSVVHAYSLLSEEKTTGKVKWKNGIMIFGHVLLFSVLYILLFVNFQELASIFI